MQNKSKGDYLVKIHKKTLKEPSQQPTKKKLHQPAVERSIFGEKKHKEKDSEGNKGSGRKYNFGFCSHCKKKGHSANSVQVMQTVWPLLEIWNEYGIWKMEK